MDELQPSDELAYRAFMVLVKDIASEITSSSQLEMLGFFEGQQVSEAKGKSALELLSGMMKKGRFSYKNTEPLQRKLTEIDRPDLARLVDKYQQEYPVRGEGVKWVASCASSTHLLCGYVIKLLEREGGRLCF